jgi:hypothetical protein
MSSALSPFALSGTGNVTQLAITGALNIDLAFAMNAAGFVGVIAVGGSVSRELLGQVDTVSNRVILSAASEREFIDLSTIRELV